MTEACKCSKMGGEIACDCVDSNLHCAHKANELYCKYQNMTCEGLVDCPTKDESASIYRCDSGGFTLLQMTWADGTSCDVIDCNDDGMCIVSMLRVAVTFVV